MRLMKEIEGNSELDKLVNRSRLLGKNANLVLYGGGNTSSKIEEINHLGQKHKVLRIKGSGCDLKTITEKDFSGLYLDQLLQTMEREEMTDEEMVDYLACCMVNATERRPSIETLLHAFLPATHVDHVHSDAICTLTNLENAEEVIQKALGSNVAFVKYHRPGFALSKIVQEYKESDAIVLEHHGLVTWGQTHEESYYKTLKLEEKANQYIEENRIQFVSMKKELEDDELIDMILTLRGELSQVQRQIIFIDHTQLEIANSEKAKDIASIGRATLEHILRIGAKSLYIKSKRDISNVISQYREDYHHYFSKFKERMPKGYHIHRNIDPKVGLIEGVGGFGVALSLDAAKKNVEIAKHSHQVAADVLSITKHPTNLSEQETFDIDYWPLELYKLTLMSPLPSLAGHIFVYEYKSNQSKLLKKLLEKGAHLSIFGEKDEQIIEWIRSYEKQVIFEKEGSLHQAIKNAILNFGGIDGVFIDNLESLNQDVLLQINNLMEKQQLNGFILNIDRNTNQLVNGEFLTSLSYIEIRNGIEGLNVLLGNNF